MLFRSIVDVGVVESFREDTVWNECMEAVSDDVFDDNVAVFTSNDHVDVGDPETGRNVFSVCVVDKLVKLYLFLITLTTESNKKSEKI